MDAARASEEESKISFKFVRELITRFKSQLVRQLMESIANELTVSFRNSNFAGVRTWP